MRCSNDHHHAFRWVAVGMLLVVGGVMVVAESGESAELPTMKYLPDDVPMVIRGLPGRVFEQLAQHHFPVEVISAVGQDTVGFDPAAIQEALFVARLPADFNPAKPTEPQFAAVLSLERPLDIQAFLSKQPADSKKISVEGLDLWRPTGINQGAPSLSIPDQRTILVGTDQLLQDMLTASKHRSAQPRGRLEKRMAEVQPQVVFQAILEVRPIRATLNQWAERAIQEARQRNELLPHIPAFKKATDLTELVELAVTMTPTEEKMALHLVANDPQAAVELEKLGKLWKKLASDSLDAELARIRPPEPTAVDLAMERYVRRVQQAQSTLTTMERQGMELSIQSETTGIAKPALMVAALLPAVQQVRAAARRMHAANNLKQVMLAAHNYHAAYGKWPADILDKKTGKPLLSWRVRLLPFLEQQALYDLLRLDESWDSEHNRQFTQFSVPVYRSPSSRLDPNAAMTNLLRPTGKGLSNDPEAKNLSIEKFRDGTSNTIWLLEVNDDQAVPWAKPADLQVDPNKPQGGLGEMHPGGFNAGFADGSVHFIDKNIDAQQLYRLFTRAAGDLVGQ